MRAFAYPTTSSKQFAPTQRLDRAGRPAWSASARFRWLDPDQGARQIKGNPDSISLTAVRPGQAGRRTSS